MISCTNWFSFCGVLSVPFPLKLLQELEGHQSHVNSIAFDVEGTNLFSGDSLGALRMWNVFVTDKPSARGVLKDWTLNKEILDGEVKVSEPGKTYINN